MEISDACFNLKKAC